MSPVALEVGDPRRAVVAPALLARFNTAGVLAAADVQVARRLARLCGEPDERVLLAVALVVRAVRGGSVCLTLAERQEMLVPEADDLADDLAGDVVGDLVPGPAQDAEQDSDGAGVSGPGRVGEADLPEAVPWSAAIEASPMVGLGSGQISDRPLRWVGGRLYLDRYWRAEQLVREQVDARLSAPVPDVDPLRVQASAHRVFGDPVTHPENARQRLAAACAAHSRLTVLTGGPGTGKTTTVAGLVAVLQAVAGPGLSVALTAPTGKAAARLQEAVRRQVAELPEMDRQRVGELDASTVHRLLGWRPGSSTRFRHDRTHHLPHDVVVVDETSMVSLPLMAKLLEALRPQTRLVLVGDPDQLASVEAGAVLGDLVARPSSAPGIAHAVAESVPADLPSEPPDGREDGHQDSALPAGVVRLVVERRYGSVIGDLARAVREGREDDVIALLRAGHEEVSLVEPATDLVSESEIRQVRADAELAGLALVRAARAGDVRAALAALESHRLLVAHRRGRFGVAYWSARVEGWVSAAEHNDAVVGARRVGVRAVGPWYPGRPLLVTANDRDSGLYNGDAGVLVAHPDPDGAPDGEAGATRLRDGLAAAVPAVVAAFGDPDRPILVRPHRLPPVETVHAMTVHRAQGSQFTRVNVLLPPAQSPLLTRELLYTALTRARSAVRVVGSEQAVRAAVRRPVRRASGLRHG